EHVRRVDLMEIRWTSLRLRGRLQPRLLLVRRPATGAAQPRSRRTRMTDRSEEESVARGAQRPNGARTRQNGARTRQNGARARTQRRPRRDNDGIIPVLAQVVREVETEVQRGHALPSIRTKFQV